MSDRAYAKVQAQQKTLIGSSLSGRLLQRTCACGESPGIDGLCTPCRNKRLTLQGSRGGFEAPSVSAAAQGNAPAQENGTSFNSAFDRASRFGHDFSRVPIHSAQTVAPQTKLKVNQPGDVYEQEADQVAEQVMHKADSAPPVSDDEDETKNSLMRKQRAEPGANAATGSPDIPPIVHAVLNNGRGQPLDTTTRAFMEPRFGYDFSYVRVHTDTRAAESALAVNALAYTVGRNVVFGEGQYAPEMSKGRRLLAHELTHLVQQNTYPVHHVIMRKADAPPSNVELIGDITLLLLQLTELQQQHPYATTREMGDLQQKLANKLALLNAPDPLVREIIFYRSRLKELKKQLVSLPLSSDRQPIEEEINQYRTALGIALQNRMTQLEKEMITLRDQYTTDPKVAPAIEKAEAEYNQSKTEQQSLSRMFSLEKEMALDSTYRTEVCEDMPEHCMGAFYKGLKGLYSPAEATQIREETVKRSRKKGETYDVDQIMTVVSAHGKAGPKQTFKYNAHTGGWIPKIEQWLLQYVSKDYAGVYAFGVSLHGGYHSVILIVDTSQEGEPQIYWMDQYATGLTKANNVTGKLEAKMKEDWLKPSYGYADTTIWPFLPTPEANDKLAPNK